MAVIDHPCSGCFDHQGSGTFRYLLALAPCHNAIRTSSLHNPEPRNLPPCSQRERKKNIYITNLYFVLR